MTDRLKYHHNHLHDLSLVGYIALIPVAGLITRVALSVIFMFRWRSLCNAIESSNLEHMQFLIGWIKSQMTWIGVPDKYFAQLLSYVLFVAITRKKSDIAIFAVEQGADVDKL